MRKLCRQFVIGLATALVSCAASAQSPVLPEPVMWRQDTFLIPYQFSAASDIKNAREVVLYLSKDWGRTWREVTRARPDVRCFTYRAEGDGDYCFAMRTIDQAGGSWPAGDPVTELRVIVDTRAPVFQTLQGAINPQGQLLVTGARPTNTSIAKALSSKYNRKDKPPGKMSQLKQAQVLRKVSSLDKRRAQPLPPRVECS
jgi:hypothetical protein